MEGSERRFEGKTAVVTGAASGMGLLFSECFLKEGGSVVMADFNEEALTEKAGALEERFPGRVLGVLTNVRNYESVVNVREKANSSSKKLGTAKKGATYTVKGLSGNWVQVNYDGKTAYIYKRYVKIG